LRKVGKPTIWHCVSLLSAKFREKFTFKQGQGWIEKKDRN